MVRTRADNCARKAVAAKAPRKLPQAASTSSPSANAAGASKYAGGNPVVVRPTPDWQKKIGTFLVTKPKENQEANSEDIVEAGPSNEMEITTGNEGCSSSQSSSSTCPVSDEPSPDTAQQPAKNGLIDDSDDE